MFPSTFAHVGLKGHGMYIQYVDRIQIAVSPRIYAFHVANAPHSASECMVTVQAEDSRAEAHLLIGDRNIKEYLGQHHPQIEHGKEGVSLT